MPTIHVKLSISSLNPHPHSTPLHRQVSKAIKLQGESGGGRSFFAVVPFECHVTPVAHNDEERGGGGKCDLLRRCKIKSSQPAS